MMKVKFCGITNEEDATWAANLGADFVGLNFWEGSARHIPITRAKKITEKIGALTKPVGIFVNHAPENIAEILKKTGIAHVQLHGDEDAAFVAALKAAHPGVQIWKAVRVADENSFEGIGAYEAADGLLLDSSPPPPPPPPVADPGGDTAGAGDEQKLPAQAAAKVYGGTGKPFKWELSEKGRVSGKLLIIAGGLNPDNVDKAIRKANPDVVDVCSGVENPKNPRKKDFERMRAFIMKARGLK